MPSLSGPERRWLTATNLLIAINVGVFIAMLASGVSITRPQSEQLLRWGGNYGPYTLQGQYWRAITSSFIHVGISHLLLNMFCLRSLGILAQKLLGGMVTFGVYLLTGAGAALMSLLWDPMRLGAGASGAIFGIAGTIITTLILGTLDIPKDQMRPALKTVALFAFYNLVFGMRAGVDNMAHLGGLLAGLLIGALFAWSFRSDRESRAQFQRMVLTGAACVLIVLFVAVKKGRANAIEMALGQQAIEAADYDSAIRHFQRYIALKPQDAEGHAMLGYTLHKGGRYNEAGEAYQRCLALKSDYPWIEVNLALIYMTQGKTEQAIPLFRKGLPNMESSADLWKSYGEALNSTHNYAAAEPALRRSIAMDAGDAETHRYLATALAGENKSEMARQETRRAEQLEQQKSQDAHK